LRRTPDESRAFAGSFCELRWHEGDVDAIIPSLYAGRGRRASDLEAEDDEPEVPSDGESPSEPNVPMPVNGGGPFTQ
jgi:hypothetical protein